VSKSLWSVFLMGIVALTLMGMAMLFSLTQFKDAPAGGHARLSQSIGNRFKFDGVTAFVDTDAAKLVLRVSYRTSGDSKFDLAAQRREMQAVADYAAAEYEGKDKASIGEIRVVRTEIKGRGCWQESYVTRESFPNPAKK
jgi:hypothetical protein